MRDGRRRAHRPATLYATTGAAIHPDHVAAADIARAAVFLARLGQWERVPGGEVLAEDAPWAVSRVFFPHCKMEPPWGEFALAVDVRAVYARKRAALAAYYTVHILNGGKVTGMLSVNGYSAQVCYHTWHGAFVQMKDLGA